MNHLEEESKRVAASPTTCILRIIPGYIFNSTDPIVLGVHVLQGMALIGAPLCVPGREYVVIGRISSIQKNHMDVPYAREGQNVAIEIIEANPEERNKMFGRDFGMRGCLVSNTSPYSIYALKKHHHYYLEDMEDSIYVQEDMESID
ncbi:eukaryotic translation initiation factor 5B [Salvia divinorum]|uniref:Eukaryotic translation initiation factor 5B n=1 Tax=Salvia divinorum TaxID=28513 RepID=A0ABD1HYH2_SALDI